MKKNRIITMSLLTLSIVALTSCSCSSLIVVGPSETPSSSIPVELGEHAGQNITLKEVKLAGDTVCLDTIGNQDILVLPVTFKDYPLERLGYKEDEVISNINTAFFGKSEETGWESVSSFYEKSSYGKLKISGEVAPLITLDKTLADFVSISNVEPTYYALEEGVKEFKKNYQGDITKFDKNNDGYLDAVWLVYMTPYLNNETKDWYLKEEQSFSNNLLLSKAQDVLWAYTYWDTTSSPSRKSPNPNVYSWASYNFLFNQNYFNFIEGYKMDSHTFIHETGHIMGLDDYYSYESKDAPCGGLDMMDNNVGDHNAHSKYLYNWVTPKIIKEAGTYHIDSFEKTGDCLLVPTSLDTFNNSPFDEYLLLEYYTPTGLNQKDAERPYESGVQNFTHPGVKIYHVDSRLCNLKYKRGSMVFDGYTDTVISTRDKYTTIAANNTPKYSHTNDRLLTLLSSQKHANSKYYYPDRIGHLADNRDLFTTRSKVDGFVFNDGQKMNYNITFSSMNEQGVDITFTAR